MKNHIISGIVALSVSLGVVVISPHFTEKENTVKIEHIDKIPSTGAVFTVNEDSEVVPLDFIDVSKKVMDAVVHIKASTTYLSPGSGQYRTIPDPFREFFRDDYFDQFFGPQQRQPAPRRQEPQARVGTGSGVIINEEGYIVTNNHVIDNADDIEVTLHDNRSYKATVIGTDPMTDLALIQINENDLVTLPMVNSDDVEVGEWVLAVGNPFNLNSTVTAGIVSAKSRNINILKNQYAVESFIQTDAAINPGNSGGALVNLQGGLVGINTAIASPTGAYAGYGFAVPSNIVTKVVEDLLKYGTVQRGYLGVTIRGINGNLVKEKNLSVNEGVYIDSVLANGAAHEAGIKKGDVIIEVNDDEVSTAPELQELIARHRPGDEVALKVIRGENTISLKAKLKNREGETTFLANNRNEVINELGAVFEDIDDETAEKLDIEGGVRVKKLYAGKLRNYTDIREGFIITKVDKISIKSTKDLAKALDNVEGGVLIEGIYEDLPGKQFYAFGM